MKPSQGTTTEQHLIQNNAKAGSSPRIEWLDVARGLCMLLIIYDHSDSYFTLLNPLFVPLFSFQAICFQRTHSL